MTKEQTNLTKEKIFREAAELFSRHGFYKVSVREICEAAGVSKPVLYYYFNDKENLLYELILESRRIVNELISANVNEESDFEKQLEGIVNLYIVFMREYPYLMKFSIFIQFMTAPEKIKKFNMQAEAEDWQKLNDLFKAAQQNGKLNNNYDHKILAQNFIGSIVLTTSKYMMQFIDRESFETELQQFLNFWKQQFVIDIN